MDCGVSAGADSLLEHTARVPARSRIGTEVIVVDNVTIDITAAAHPCTWTNPVFAATRLTAATATMPVPANDRSVNYIGSTTAAAGSLRPDLGAKQAAPPRGNLR
jgi:hypothetical protein